MLFACAVSVHSHLRPRPQLCWTQCQTLLQLRQQSCLQTAPPSVPMHQSASRQGRRVAIQQGDVPPPRSTAPRQAALHKQHEQEMALDSEMSGVRKAIKNEEEKNETLTTTHNKLNAEAGKAVWRLHFKA